MLRYVLSKVYNCEHVIFNIKSYIFGARRLKEEVTNKIYFKSWIFSIKSFYTWQGEKIYFIFHLGHTHEIYDAIAGWLLINKYKTDQSRMGIESKLKGIIH